MSEKQLAKSAWEAVAKKSKVDERALSKALSAYEKCGEHDLAGQADALKAIAKCAEDLKKDKAYKEVADYLGETLAAAARVQKALAAEKEGEEDESEGEDPETAEYAKDLGKQLKAALAQVKSRAPQEGESPEGGAAQLRFMAYVAAGDGAVIVAKRTGGAARKLVAKIAGKPGGKYLQGECIFEKSAFTFVLDQPPSGLAHVLAKALLEEAGQKYRVRVRGTDGTVEGDEQNEAETEEGETSTPKAPIGTADEGALMARLKALKADLDRLTGSTAPSAGAAKAQFLEVATLLKGKHLSEAEAKLPQLETLIAQALRESASPTSPPGEAEAEFKKRLSELMPRIKEALTAAAPAAAEIREKAGEASAAAKEHDFARGQALLDEIDALLHGGSKADAEASFKERLAALMPKIKEAVGAGTPAGQAVRLKAAEASALAKQHDFGQALARLSEIEILLGAPSASTAAAGQAGARPVPSLVQLQRSRLAWDGLRKTIQSQLPTIEQAILAGVRAHNEDETAEDEYEEGGVASAVKSLYGILDKLDQRLIDKLDEALNATSDEERQARHLEAAAIIKEYQAFAASDPILAMIDENGFAPSSIRAAVTATLGDLAGKF